MKLGSPVFMPGGATSGAAGKIIASRPCIVAQNRRLLEHADSAVGPKERRPRKREVPSPPGG
jgi:hypothetical protein